MLPFFFFFQTWRIQKFWSSVVWPWVTRDSEENKISRIWGTFGKGYWIKTTSGEWAQRKWSQCRLGIWGLSISQFGWQLPRRRGLLHTAEKLDFLEQAGSENALTTVQTDRRGEKENGYRSRRECSGQAFGKTKDTGSLRCGNWELQKSERLFRVGLQEQEISISYVHVHKEPIMGCLNWVCLFTLTFWL